MAVVVVILGVAVVGGFRQSLSGSLDKRLTQNVQLVASELSSSSEPETAVNRAADALTGFYVVLRTDEGVPLRAGSAAANQSVLQVPATAWPSAPGRVALTNGSGSSKSLRFALERLPRPFAVTKPGSGASLEISSVGVGESNQEIADGVGSLVRTFVICGLIAVVVAAVAARWVAGEITKPVEALSDAAVRVARSGDLTTRVSDRSGTPELKRLARSMNSALEHVQEMYGALESVLIQQRRFIRDASHELRTPLTTVSSTLETLTLLPEMDGRQRNEIVGNALAESKRMNRLVDGLLTLAAYDSGGNVTRKSFKWHDVVSAVGAYAAQTLAPRRVEITSDADLGSAWGDAVALRQMMERCIDNVHDHTPETTTVRLTARRRRDDAVDIGVADDGPGVAERLLSTLTSRFVRADASRTDGKPGLGLSIADAIAGAHGGSLVVSRVKPHGLSVVATIPRGKPADRPERRRAPRPRKTIAESES